MHDAGLYSQFRPDYPPALFAEVVRRLASSEERNLLSVVDLASGAGQSARSFFRALQDEGISRPIAMTLVDQDPGMIREAQGLLSKETGISGLVSPAEKTQLLPQSANLILIGSAVHWLKRPEIFIEASRLLKKSGLLMIFEYQFPKLSGNPEAPLLAEWIRTQFNQRWRAPGQVPRGKFSELLAPLHRMVEYRAEASGPVPMVMDLGLDELAGFLSSQSRFLDYEGTLPEEERENYRAELRRELGERLSERRVVADFRLEFALFSKDI